jgi:Tfp pilus assembly protein FimT
VELLAVVLMLGVLAAVAVPSLNGMSTQRRAAAARQLVRDLTFARTRAMATGTNSWVVFNTASGTWSVLAENPASPGRVGATTITDPATQQTMVERVGADEFAGVSITSVSFNGQSEVGFDRLGRPLMSNGTAHTTTGTVVFSGGWTVSVLPSTGVASLTGVGS